MKQVRGESELSDLVAANQQLTDQVAELATTNAALDEFAAIAAHDLQQPLRGMRAHCELLLEDSAPQLDADGQRRLAALTNLCQRLERLTDDLLAHARLGGRPSTHPMIDLNEVVGDVLATLEPVLEQSGALVRVSSRLPHVSADAVAVGEVFRNLLGNALKFNASDCPTIEMGSRASGELYVRDNGIGIEPRHHEAIFAKFRRLHAPSQYAGSGLGLALVRKIVEAHGGRVRVESEVGRGSTFYFTFGLAMDVASSPSKPLPVSVVHQLHAFQSAPCHQGSPLPPRAVVAEAGALDSTLAAPGRTPKSDPSELQLPAVIDSWQAWKARTEVAPIS